MDEEYVAATKGKDERYHAVLERGPEPDTSVCGIKDMNVHSFVWEPAWNDLICRDCVVSLVSRVDQVKLWLRTQGYPLELQVAHVFELDPATDRVRSSAYYTDADGRSREIDVVAEYRPQSSHLEVRCIVECKHITEPIVGFVRPDPDRSKDGLARRYPMNPSTHQALKGLGSRVPRPRPLDPFEFHETDRIAHLVTSALRTKTGAKDVAYEAVESVTAAALDGEIVDGWETRPPCFKLNVPVVVVEGAELIEGHLDSGGLQLREVDHIVAVLGAAGTPVHLLTTASLERFVEQVRSTVRELSLYLQAFDA